MKNFFADKWDLSVCIHFMLALCGGFFGVYAIESRMGIFGQAQTSNLIDLVCDIIGRNMADGTIRFVAAVLFIGGMVSATVLEKRSKFNVRHLAILINISAAVLLGFFPLSMNPIVALYPVFFAASFQWCVFRGAKGYVSATIFSTNNLKQTTVSIVEYFLLPKGDATRCEKKQKAMFFGGTLLSFHTGVVIGYLLFIRFSFRCIWFCVLPLLVSYALVSVNERSRSALNSLS